MKQKIALVLLVLQPVVALSSLFSTPSPFEDNDTHAIDMSEISDTRSRKKLIIQKVAQACSNTSPGVRNPLLSLPIKDFVKFMNEDPEGTLVTFRETVTEKVKEKNDREISSRVQRRRTVTCCKNSGQCLAAGTLLGLGVISSIAYVAAPIGQAIVEKVL